MQEGGHHSKPNHTRGTRGGGGGAGHASGRHGGMGDDPKVEPSRLRCYRFFDVSQDHRARALAVA
jgi:hypothetical protein